ncbi:hypothetical protein ALQ08_01107 [Pseudomonas syringae pv. delphinii]|uniref:Uncharacterized protein n=1 Tax=Pseudomonas syringae pv. delphinii TaxID=192088 RepID=A0A0N8RFA9_9PSED|nr:hypothetical protein [Pseudomonas syringae group genomosp. 3]KPX22679.1 Uncharacterized protein ALO72_02539 [Pseudomonas syringae pv. delphinii]RMP08736.1 hypothetical protein ALQ28_03258 [Pseudomonas syringae pv. delphinii]RMP28174.1 hypothetical protein ALQ27_02923 [Pseudomonas syringae pv. delphinii]RMQ22975.1 hypothetical protein ALQ08_01107 [Pseudomonas syringae pv. delphinii]
MNKLDLQEQESTPEGPSVTAMELGRALHEWARRHGALTMPDAASSPEQMSLEQIYETDSEAAKRISQALHKLKITAVTADDSNKNISVLCKNAISSQISKKLPTRVHGIDISYTGKVTVETNPPALPFSAQSGSPIWFSHADKICCGSSVTTSQVFDAGTFGFLANLADGRLVGFSNNHVTGECNHTPPGMHILSPSPLDASPSSPPPVAIGTHFALLPLNSGDPNQISLQETDAAIFLITRPDLVSSMQGNGFYDTPSSILPLSSGLRVKKVGRTTGLRPGTVLGEMVVPFFIPYKSNKFQSIVYFSGVWAIQGDGGNTFSEGGDSGSLVVTIDGGHSVGVVFAGGNNVSYILPIGKILDLFKMTLVTGHNSELANEPSAVSQSPSTEAQPS